MPNSVIDNLQQIQTTIDSCIENIKQVLKESNDLKVSDQFLHLYADSFNSFYDRNTQLLTHFKDRTS